MSTREYAMLKVTVRSKLGSRYAARSRASGKLPGVIYGHKQDPVAIDLDATDAIRHFKAGEKIFRMDFPGTKNADEGQMVLLKSLQFDWMGDNVVHADFARVDLNERVTVKVHVELKGEALGLKSAGRILIHPINEIEIECRVADIPESITLNISELDVDQTITANKVALPKDDMKLVTDGHAVVAAIIEQKEEVVAEAATVAGATTPEVIGEKEKAAAAGAAPAAGAKGAAPAAGAKAAAPAAKK